MAHKIEMLSGGLVYKCGDVTLSVVEETPEVTLAPSHFYSRTEAQELAEDILAVLAELKKHTGVDG